MSTLENKIPLGKEGDLELERARRLERPTSTLAKGCGHPSSFLANRVNNSASVPSPRVGKDRGMSSYVLTGRKTALDIALENPAMNAQSPSTDRPKPEYKEWAAKSGTPYQVTFPKRGATPTKRRFFKTAEEAEAEIEKWMKDRKPEASLGKRVVDEVVYWRSILPAGVTIGDCCRFYLAHHSGASVTVKETAELYLADLKAQKKAEKYREEQERMAGIVVAELGVGKPRLLKFIKADTDSYWNRYARKRIISCLISKARELGGLPGNPLDGWRFEDAPKGTPHFLQLWEVEAILNYTLRHKPDLVTSFALQFFAGIRTEELCRSEVNGKRPLRWSDITFGESINIPVEVSKTNDRRVIDYWPPALSNWITKPGEGEDRVCSYEGLDDAKSKLIKALNKERSEKELPLVDFRQNDFRRTYATNSVQMFGGEKTKERMGHEEDSKVLKKNYDGLTTKPKATAYYQSRPEPLISTAAHAA
jgi:hypothetical protein